MDASNKTVIFFNFKNRQQNTISSNQIANSASLKKIDQQVGDFADADVQNAIVRDSSSLIAKLQLTETSRENIFSRILF